MVSCFKKAKVYSIDSYESFNMIDIKSIDNNIETFLKENILCFNCKKTHPLRSNKIKISCAGCDNFFCCGIAGECIGEDCNASINGKEFRQRYCIMCSGKLIIKGKTCLCKSCNKQSL